VGGQQQNVVKRERFLYDSEHGMAYSVGRDANRMRFDAVRINPLF